MIRQFKHACKASYRQITVAASTTYQISLELKPATDVLSVERTIRERFVHIVADTSLAQVDPPIVHVTFEKGMSESIATEVLQEVRKTFEDKLRSADSATLLANLTVEHTKNAWVQEPSSDWLLDMGKRGKSCMAGDADLELTNETSEEKIPMFRHGDLLVLKDGVCLNIVRTSHGNEILIDLPPGCTTRFRCLFLPTECRFSLSDVLLSNTSEPFVITRKMQPNLTVPSSSPPSPSSSAPDDEGATPLHRAAAAGDADACALLLDGGASHDPDNHGNTPLYLAARNGHPDVCILLLKRGATHVPNHNGYTPLFVAARNSDTQVCEVLLEFEASHVADKDGNTPLHLAAEFGSEEVCRILLEGGAKHHPNKYGETPLYVAARQGRGRERVCGLLLRSGATHAPDKRGVTPADCARLFGRTQIVNILRAHAGLPPLDELN